MVSQRPMRPLVGDALWTRIAPLLPKERPKPKGGRPHLSDRAALTGIRCVFLTGVSWERRGGIHSLVPRQHLLFNHDWDWTATVVIRARTNRTI